MSLTSYLAAPSRVGCFILIVLREFGDLFRFGGDLLSRGLSPSTIGAAALNFRVRDGTGCFARAMTTKPKKIPVVFCSARGDEPEAAYLRSKCAFRAGLCFNQRFPLGAAALSVSSGVMLLALEPVFLLLDQIKPVGRLVPVS